MSAIMRLAASKTTRGRAAPRRLFYAAAFSSLSGSSWAFVAPRPSVGVGVPLGHPLALTRHSEKQQMLHQTMVQQSRLFFSQKDDSNDWETFKRAGGNLLKSGVEKVKSLIPFGKSDEEKRAEIVKKERKEEIKGGINTMLKDMPLPIRMMGRMVSPLLARAADEIAEQTKQAQDMLEDARIRIVNDPVLAEELGEPLQVGVPFSQASSTTVINGKSTAMVRASFQVAGPRGNGVATMESNNNEITSLTVNVNGRNIAVGSRRGGNVFGNSSSKSDDNVIEAEIIEKK